MSDRVDVPSSVRRTPCPRCATWPEPGAHFCTFCGASLARPARSRSSSRGTAVVIGTVAAIIGVAVVALAVVGGQRPAGARESASASASATPSARESAEEGAAAGDLGEAFGTSLGADDVVCAGGELECVRLTVPADHADPTGATVEVRFGHHAADPDERIGTLVIATGGPGSSGIELAQAFLAIFPDAVLDRYDVVFFEQRGVRRSAEIACEDAELETPRWTEVDLADLEAALHTVSDWVELCLDEAGVDDASTLDAYGTFQAAADLDAYLDHIGAEKVVLFGESYGTQLVQTYAAHRPQRVAGLILDGVVDPTIDAIDASVQQADAFSNLLERVLDSCADDPFCADDFPTATATNVWDELATRLRDAPLAVDLPSRNGSSITLSLSYDDLIATSAGLLYTERDRSVLLRLLASAARDDFKPLLRTASVMFGLDPETGRPISPFYESSASYLAIACQDLPADVDRGLGVLLRELGRLQADGSRLAPIVLNDLPCFGGFAGEADGEPFEQPASASYPVLVLTSEADPATPMAWAEAVADRHENAHLVVTRDGAHGSFGWGLSCPDDLVKEFLVFGDLPDERRTECDGYLVDPYRPLPLGGPDAYPDVLEALIAVEESIISMPDFLFWDGTPRRIGCPHGGWMQMSYVVNDSFLLHDCQVLPDWPLSGSVDFAADFTTTMELEMSNGELSYESTETWEVTVTGTLDGVPIDLSSP